MKNRKIICRFAVIVIAVIFAICACNQKQLNEAENDYRVAPAEDGKTLVITRYQGKKQAVDIPAVIYKLSITGIGKGTFTDKDLVNVTIPNSVTSIGNRAFADNDLINVVIGSGVITIGDGAFINNQLSVITIPNSVTTIGEGAFARNKFTSVTIPAGVTSIGNTPFFYCQKLTAITVSPSNKNYASADGVLYNKSLTELIQWPSGKTGDAAIPSGVTVIKKGSLAGSQLTSVTIPDGVTTIEEGAFNDNQLTSVTIPSSVTAIGDGAFTKNQLTSITIGADVALESSYYSASIGYNFEYYYRNAGKKAGTYSRSNVNSYDWSRRD